MIVGCIFTDSAVSRLFEIFSASTATASSRFLTELVKADSEKGSLCDETLRVAAGILNSRLIAGKLHM